MTTDSAIAQTPLNNNEEQDFDFNVPFGDDDSQDEQNRPPRDPSFGASTLGDSALDLSRDTLETNNASALGLSMDEDLQENNNNNKRESTAKPRKRRRKRRKVVIDNHQTELTNDHIRAMLQNTEDIVRPMLHPASVWDESGDSNTQTAPKTYALLVLEERQKQQQQQQPPKRNAKKQPMEIPSLTQPFLQDSNTLLHPKLQSLWKDNYWKALGQDCPYPKHQTADEVEALRRDQTNDDDSSKGDASDLEVPQAEKMETADEPEELEEFPTVLDDENEEELDVPVPDFGDQDEVALQRKSTDGNDDDLLDLGMVNDMVLDSDEEDETEEDRQALGDVSSSSTKWHKHTVRVYKHLQKCIQDPNSTAASEEETKPESVDFDELTKHVVSRRNASSIFFEMLQLKTWDFIEVDQDQAYGKIAISAGLRFGEDAPNN